MYINNEFILNNGEKVEIILRVEVSFEVDTENLSNLIFNERAVEGHRIDSIYLKAASGDKFVALKKSDISAYTASIIVLK